ncbi:response regulator transcription factor [Cytobacillus oceanisediminis]|uniref:DNA-binding response regulator n=1 Tax=Cytobacillus oceanisediminis 2691 TaxID=1196031 RepID=A0A160MBK1_9BACI|nr:response regulator transcription factor [Cytobacillus oceanisediminis]MCS0826721.1 helix-turn-helix domain-containing protein [Cytobacillus firmus]AND40014.1 DNA-binding response regulator [Cytobacillus oceanisediminis 2691]MCM3244034.1 helix-turn-helix domain-containing protein [Cytobacillus oceanisediminis]MCM3402434.1 helix-turn-helix domain-containing protein [Cytobacillus oceanisediminis]MCM3530996.1 helix-turn-helix domain-containing protein [Cytobacillus oceanisediminis]
MYKVLVANRDEYDTKGIEWLLKSSMNAWQVESAQNEAGLIKKLETFQPDLLIFELDLINEESFGSFLKTTQIIGPDLIALTMEATFSQAKRAIDMGVSDLILKPISADILLKSARKIHRRNQMISRSAEQKSSQKAEKDFNYQDLFIEESNSAEPLVSIGIKSKNPLELPKLFKFLESYTFQKTVHYFILSDMILIIAEKSDVAWKEESLRFMRDWQETSAEQIAISIYTGKEGSGTVRSHYLANRKLMELTFYRGFNQVIEESSLPKWLSIDPFLTPEEQSRWIDFLNQSDLEALKSWFYEEFLILADPYPEPGLIRIRLTSILAQIRRHMKTFRLADGDMEKEYLRLFQTILYSPLIYQVINEMISFISFVFETIRSDKKLKLELTDRVLFFIETNYWDPKVTLERAAEYADRNPNYISSMLAKKCGKSFRELLNETRIRQSAKLLMESEISIKEIASVCGFRNQQYFNKVFSKIKGMPPNQFRKSMHKTSV